jgi:uncharacterized protein (DUF849 family)
MNPIYDLGIPHPVTPYRKLIINACITGMVPVKKDTPHVPLTVDEIVADATACYDAGASMIHVHARDDEGKPTYKKEVYADIISGIRAARPDTIICASTSGRVHNTFEYRSEVLELEGDAKPDMGSLTMGSLDFPGQASINDPEMVKNLATAMKDRGIVPEIECFETGMIQTTKVLIKRGVLVEPFYYNLLLGSIFSAPGTLFDLSHMVMSLPPGVQWGGAGIGKFQLKMNFASILMGGHVRVGIEDNIWFDQDAKELATNSQLIERVANFSRQIGRAVASAKEAREIIGID